MARLTNFSVSILEMSKEKMNEKKMRQKSSDIISTTLSVWLIGGLPRILLDVKTVEADKNIWKVLQ